MDPKFKLLSFQYDIYIYNRLLSTEIYFIII